VGAVKISPMARTILIWALVLAAGAFVLQWLQYQYLARAVPGEIYIALIAVLFAVGGAWVALRLRPRPVGPGFERNEAALKALGITGQELRVLERVAAGQSTKEIARTLGLSPNTVKTHTTNLYAKLEVGRRTQAVGKARELGLIP
jgi:DNA-binding CsgD family transcriptional regulator